MLEKLKKYLASKVSTPLGKLLPNQTYIYTVPSNKQTVKSVLPKTPTYRQLRNFAKNPIVRRALNLVEDTVCRLPYDIVLKEDKPSRKYKKQIRVIKNIIENPNIIHGRKAFFRMVLEDLLVLDAGVFEKAKAVGDTEHPLYLYPVDGSTIQFVIPYDYTDANAPRYAQLQNEGTKYFTASDIGYIQRNVFTDKPFGLSPVLTAYNYIRHFIDGGEQTAQQAENGTSGYLISLGEDVTTDEVNAFRDYMAEEIEGTGRIPVIGGTKNPETKPIKTYGQDSLYLEWLKFLIQIIAVAFPLPPEKIGLIVPSDRFKISEINEVLTEEFIKPYAELIEDAINLHIIKELGWGDALEFKFIYEDSETAKNAKSARLVSEYANDVITENEFRTFMGYDLSDSKYADITSKEKTALINVDNGIAGGFNGVGEVKNNYQNKTTKPDNGTSE